MPAPDLRIVSREVAWVRSVAGTSRIRTSDPTTNRNETALIA